VKPVYRQTGFTLTELLVGTAIGLLLISAAISTYLHTRKIEMHARIDVQLLETALFALNEVADDLRQTGYWGRHADGSRIVRDSAGTVRCRATLVTTWALQLRPSFSGSDNSYNPACPADSYVADTDTLTLRYVVAAQPDKEYLQLFTDRRWGYLHATEHPDSTGLTDPQNYRLVVHGYFISDDTPAGSKGLRRWTLGKHGQLRNELVIDGISDLQLLYGATDASGNIRWQPEPFAEAMAVSISVTASTYTGGRLRQRELNRVVRIRNRPS